MDGQSDVQPPEKPVPEKRGGGEKEDPEEPRVYSGLKTVYWKYLLVALGILILLYLLLGYRPVKTGFADYSPSVLDDYLSNPDKLKERYNDNVGSIPSPARWLFGDERADVLIKRIDGTEAGMAIVMENGMIESVSIGRMNDPTISIMIYESAIEKIYESNNPTNEIEQGMDDDGIEYDSHRFFTAIRAFFLHTAINVIALFS